MHQASSSCVGTGRPSLCSAYWIEPVMPGLGSVRVPSRSKKIVSMLVRIPRGEVARDLDALVDVAADRDGGCRRAAAIGLLKAVIAAVEGRDHAGAAVAGGRLGVDQRLHLVAPFQPFIVAADTPEIMQRAKDLGEALQVAIEGRCRILGPGGGDEGRNQQENGSEVFWHSRARYAPSMGLKQGTRRIVLSMIPVGK